MTKFSLSSFPCLSRSISALCSSHVCIWPWLAPAETQKIGWMREWKSLNDWGRGMGDGGFFFVASLCSRHEVPKYHQFFSLCILFSLSLLLFSLSPCLSTFQALSWLSFFLNTQHRPLMTSQPWAVCVWRVSWLDSVYFFIHTSTDWDILYLHGLLFKLAYATASVCYKLSVHMHKYTVFGCQCTRSNV